MGNRNKKKPVEKFKSRKELRKDKRLQKKANRVHFQKRKKELKIEYKEKQRQKILGKSGGQGNSAKPSKKLDKIDDRQHSDMDEDDAHNDVDDGDDDDEEIESDFDLSDQELEQKTTAIAKQQSRYISIEPSVLI